MDEWEQVALFDLCDGRASITMEVHVYEGKCIGWQVEARDLVTARLLGLTYAPRLPSTSGSNVQEALAHAQRVAERYLDPF